MKTALAKYQEPAAGLAIGAGSVVVLNAIHEQIKPTDATKRDYAPWVLVFLAIWGLTKTKNNAYLRAAVLGVGVYAVVQIVRQFFPKAGAGLGCPDCGGTCGKGMGEVELITQVNHRKLPGYQDWIYEYFFANPNRPGLVNLARAVYDNACNFYQNVQNQLNMWTGMPREVVERDFVPNLLGLNEPGHFWFFRLDRIAGQGGSQALSDPFPKAARSACNLPEWQTGALVQPTTTPPPVNTCTAATIASLDDLRCVHQTYPGYNNTVFGLLQYPASTDAGVIALWRQSGTACDLYNNIACMLEVLAGSAANVALISKVTFTVSGGRYGIVLETKDGKTAIDNYALGGDCGAKCPPTLPPSTTTPGGETTGGDLLTLNPPPPSDDATTTLPPFPNSGGYVDDGSGMCWNWGQNSAYVSVWAADCPPLPRTGGETPTVSESGGASILIYPSPVSNWGSLVNPSDFTALPDSVVIIPVEFGDGYEIAIRDNSSCACTIL